MTDKPLCQLWRSAYLRWPDALTLPLFCPSTLPLCPPLRARVPQGVAVSNGVGALELVTPLRGTRPEPDGPPRRSGVPRLPLRPGVGEGLRGGTGLRGG